MRYDWSQEQQGYILSSFFVGYVIAHIPAGALAERFGGKKTLSLAILSISICNIATPLSLAYGGIAALILLRILMGLTSGVMFPALTVLLAAWIPVNERTKFASLALGGSQVQVHFLLTLLLEDFQYSQLISYFFHHIR